MHHINLLEKVINSLSLGSAVIVNKRINNKDIVFFIIKDKFDDFFYSSDDLFFQCKGGLITHDQIIASNLTIKIFNGYRDEYYSLFFDYFNEKSLSIIVNLIKQKEIYMILANELGDCKELRFKNELQQYFKIYIKRVLKCGYTWNEDRYNCALKNIAFKIGNNEDLWFKLGDPIELSNI